MRLLLVMLGGAVGSAARYLATVALAERLGVAFPWGTFAVNLTGSFAIGLLATLADEARWLGPHTRLLLIVGVLGGFTTFSSFSLDALRLAEDGATVRALLYVAGSVALSLLAAVLGVGVGRVLAR